MSEPVALFDGADPRCEALCQALLALIYDRGAGLPVPSVIGVLRIVEHKIIAQEASP